MAKGTEQKIIAKVTYTEGYQQRIFDAIYEVIYKKIETGMLEYPPSIWENRPK